MRPDDPALLARLGRAYLADQPADPGGTRVLTQSVAARPQPAQTYADLGLARLGTGDAVGATAALEHAVALDPAHAGAAQLLGEINAKLYGAGHAASRRRLPAKSDEEAPMALTGRYPVLRFDGRHARSRDRCSTRSTTPSTCRSS